MKTEAHPLDAWPKWPLRGAGRRCMSGQTEPGLPKCWVAGWDVNFLTR
jgi:hypothetical protein